MLSPRRLSFTLSFVFNDTVSPEKYSIQKLLKKMLHKCYEIVNYLCSKKRSTILKKNRNLRRYSSYLVNACGWNVIAIRNAAWRQWIEVSVLVSEAVSGMLRWRVRIHTTRVPGIQSGLAENSPPSLVFRDATDLTRALWSPRYAHAEEDYPRFVATNSKSRAHRKW